MAKAKRPVRKKEKLSKEENLYRSAVSLMEAVDCISRFERVVYSLNDAANKFDKLDGYKDSAERGRSAGEMQKKQQGRVQKKLI